MKAETRERYAVRSPQSAVCGMQRVLSFAVILLLLQPNINASTLLHKSFSERHSGPDCYRERTIDHGQSPATTHRGPRTADCGQTGQQSDSKYSLTTTETKKSFPERHSGPDSYRERTIDHGQSPATTHRGPRTADCGQTPWQQTDSTFTHIKTIPIEAKEIQTDRLGNIYVVSKTNQLYKYSNNGKLLSTLNYKYLGNITFVDATNPLEIYVFYKELNLVVFLDNNLAYRGELALSDYNIGQASAIARSFDNGVWIFDLADMELQKMGKDGSNPLSSGNMRQYTSANSSISYLYDNDDRVFVNDSANGIFVFDVFATYLKTLPIKGCDEIKVIDQELFYHQAHTSTLKKYRLNTFQTTEYPLPESTGIIDISIEKNRLYLLKTGEVVIYGF